MAGVTITVRKLLKWMAPYGLVMLARQMQDRKRSGRILRRQRPFAGNETLRDRHRGRRCFIVATGPSVKNQDLRQLAGELVITVSNAYLHQHCDVFKPAYHCVPQITYGKMTPDDVLRWFADMDAQLGSTEMVLSNSERDLVTGANLFKARAVHYLGFENRPPNPDSSICPDLAAPVPGPQSVPVMALMLALYMGCKDIYLLGVDHDFFLTRSYTYFYERSPVSDLDSSVAANGQVTSSRYEEFHVLNLLWRQYRWLRNCAEADGRRIYNATDGGELDEFERVDFRALRLTGDDQGCVRAGGALK
jgi:hypothetical protein